MDCKADAPTRRCPILVRFPRTRFLQERRYLRVVIATDAADTNILHFVASHRVGGVNEAMKVLTHFGSRVLLVPICVTVGLVLLARGRGWAAVQLAVAYASAEIVFQGLKLAVRRDRPPMHFRLVAAHGSSFPSGHATLIAAVCATAVSVATSGGSSRRVAVSASLVVFAFLVGASRVYLGVHWPTDVLAGWFIGLVCAAVSLRVTRGRRRPRGGQGDVLATT
jgi:undecaprenyl-diphosphatase